MRHSTAVHLLKSGVDLSTIGQWLGHASLNTTNKYATIDLDLKRQALAQADSPVPEALASWRHDATILEWLASLSRCRNVGLMHEREPFHPAVTLH
jgi:integrase/recombinase XerD